MLISEVAKLSGVSKDTVRLYTQKGIVHCQQKTAGSRQYAEYAPDAVELIKNVKLAQSLGFTLQEIKVLADELGDAPITNRRHREIIQAKLKDIEQKQKQLDTLAAILRAKLKKLSVAF
jgi:MerR family copper efflux transcriptional regulator